MATQFPQFFAFVSSFSFFVGELEFVCRAPGSDLAPPVRGRPGKRLGSSPWRKLQLSIQAGRAKTQLSSTS